MFDPNDKRVLLVEDEPLVSMMLADMLSAFGNKVDGPYSRFGDAIHAAKTNNLQAGILDVNLGGEKTYAVANISHRPEDSLCIRDRLRAGYHHFSVCPCAGPAETN